MYETLMTMAPTTPRQIAIELVQREMRHLGLTHRDAAKEMSIAPSTLSDFFQTFKEPSARTVDSINGTPARGGLRWPRGFLQRVLDGDVKTIARMEIEDRDLKLYALSLFEQIEDPKAGRRAK
jgi:hypothetical protein